MIMIEERFLAEAFEDYLTGPDRKKIIGFARRYGRDLSVIAESIGVKNWCDRYGFSTSEFFCVRTAARIINELEAAGYENIPDNKRVFRNLAGLKGKELIRVWENCQPLLEWKGFIGSGEVERIRKGKRFVPPKSLDLVTCAQLIIDLWCETPTIVEKTGFGKPTVQHAVQVLRSGDLDLIERLEKGDPPQTLAKLAKMTPQQRAVEAARKSTTNGQTKGRTHADRMCEMLDQVKTEMHGVLQTYGPGGADISRFVKKPQTVAEIKRLSRRLREMVMEFCSHVEGRLK